MTLSRGLYDQVITEQLARQLDLLASGQVVADDLKAAHSIPLLTDLVTQSLSRVLAELGTSGNEVLLQQVEIINGLLGQLRRGAAGDISDQQSVAAPPRRLRAVRNNAAIEPHLPETGLAAPWLFTAAKSSPSLLSELRTEAADCDQIDILVSFITVAGVRKIIDVLKLITAGDAEGRSRAKIRVLTTTYTGATEFEAVKELAQLNNCEVRVSLDGRRTRLHAKAWIFHRNTGFGSAYVGSANLSGAALMGGLEWTVKFTQRSQEALFQRAKAHFDTLWEDDEFQAFDPASEVSARLLRAALASESGAFTPDTTTYFDVTAKRYQQDILEQLQIEREHGRNRNLLVAATGTGKTVMAALDYRRTVESTGGARPRLLFVAHRQEILEQAMRTYRMVLRDHSFGALLAGGEQPESYDHLFATIQSITSRGIVAECGPGYWHTVVIDECHRIAGESFSAFASAVQPNILLGLTATPERTDGQPLAPYFTPRPDGSPAAELRLWHALDLQLLAPFEYFGCNDDTDFSDVTWGQPSEAAMIDRLVTGNHVRAALVADEWERLSGGAKRTKALVFCVSIAHAEFMTAQFRERGIPVLCLTGQTPDHERDAARRRLQSGEICAIVTVDLYNEGVDLPFVDTLLFLRPTQSALLFQQQLGRGLRLNPGKASCLVLDFVGRHSVRFRFDRLLSSITGLNRRELTAAVKDGFSTLPSGCFIHLERQAQQRVLENLQAATNNGWAALQRELQAYAAIQGNANVALGAFLRDQQVELDEVFRQQPKSGWTTLRREAGFLGAAEPPAKEHLYSRAMRLLTHVDDPEYIGTVRRVAEQGATYNASSPADATRAQMFAYQLDIVGGPHAFGTAIDQLASAPECVKELSELCDVLESRSHLVRRDVPGLPGVPLALHARYKQREILTAVGRWNAERRPPHQTGVLALNDRKCELLFVTLDKSDGFHDSVAYHDYAVSPTLFHWQTQNAAGPDTATGRRYIESLTNGWTFQLFVRTNQDAPYIACGPVAISSADDITGDRPMNVRWTLQVPLPIALFREFSVLRVGE
jgi:superfamily II DNA or RNA helicase/HKD family nuclease